MSTELDRTRELERLLRERIVILDGAMGTMIQGYKLDEAGFRGERFKDCPQDLKGNNDLLSLTQPEIIQTIQRQYLEAGADIIESNTFNSTSISLADYKLEGLAYELNVAGSGVGTNCSAGQPSSGGSGLIRLEAYSITTNIIYGNYLTSTPNALALPASPPSTVQVTSINGVAVKANPFTFPDLQLTTGAQVPVIIQGVYIPPNTQGSLYVFSESTPDLIKSFTLTGTLANTTATVNIPFPPGG